MNIIISVSTIWPNQIHYNTTVICSQQHWSLPQWSSDSICEKKFGKGNISWAQVGSGGPLEIIGPGHFFVTRFEPWKIAISIWILAINRFYKPSLALKFSLKSDAFVLRYLILKKPTIFCKQLLKKRLLFGILYLEKETTVVAENFRIL